MKKIIALVLSCTLGIMLGIGITAGAATKSATFVPPADHTAIGWTICMAPTAVAGTYTFSVSACATDSVAGISDCKSQTISLSGATFDTFADNRLAAWRTAFGY